MRRLTPRSAGLGRSRPYDFSTLASCTAGMAPSGCGTGPTGRSSWLATGRMCIGSSSPAAASAPPAVVTEESSPREETTGGGEHRRASGTPAGTATYPAAFPLDPWRFVLFRRTDFGESMNLGPRDLAGARPSSPPSPRAARTPRRLQGVGNARCPGGHRNRQRHRRLGHRVLLRHHERPLGLERQWRRGYFHAQGSFTNVTVPAAALGIYANGSTWYASTSLGLAISTDAGATWALRGVAAGVPTPANDAWFSP